MKDRETELKKHAKTISNFSLDKLLEESNYYKENKNKIFSYTNKSLINSAEKFHLHFSILYELTLNEIRKRKLLNLNDKN